ncbi:c-type cytochrome [Thiocapsa bogorovii]|jgi:mono/diheme cytochrome c family protein|uniref:c-type cytochrome n=1 Tax=Thiocapsa bogorovii TaxID=521689 RepID=UPI001E54260A|nr:cytochrome c [Thiocapsa bogorovii]UHD16185.1 cytochrome c [Thiocapsa bogorovii]
MKIQPRFLAAAAAAALLLGLGSVTAQAQPTENAKELYEDNCLSCHGSEIFTREGRMVTSLDGLERQVQRCETALGLRWFDEDIKDVATYLNQNYYNFER